MEQDIELYSLPGEVVEDGTTEVLTDGIDFILHSIQKEVEYGKNGLLCGSNQVGQDAGESVKVQNHLPFFVVVQQSTYLEVGLITQHGQPILELFVFLPLLNVIDVLVPDEIEEGFVHHYRILPLLWKGGLVVEGPVPLHQLFNFLFLLKSDRLILSGVIL